MRHLSATSANTAEIMVKCGRCAKFMAANTAAKCSKCLITYHCSCVDLPEKGTVNIKWVCPGCKGNSLTLPEGTAAEFHTPEHRVSPSLINPHDAASNNVPEELKIDLALEIRAIRNELSSLRAEFREYREENTDFKSTVNEGLCVLDSRINALESKFEQIVPTNIDVLEDTIAELKCQINERDQDTLLNDIEIVGIPEYKEESPMHLVTVLSAKMGIDIDIKDIVHVERVGSTRRNRVETNSTGSTSTDTHRPIAVRFARRATRDCLLREARVRRTISSADVVAAGRGPPRRIYINERLTPTNRRLFYQARRAAQQHQWKYVWTRDGKILARKEDGKLAERIRTDKDITKIFGSSSVCP